jgi:hypothetical protein
MFQIQSVRCVTASIIACAFTLGCSAGPEDGTSTESPAGGVGIDYAASSPPGGTLTAGLSSRPAAPEFGEVEGDEMLARVQVSDSHTVTFWRVLSGRVVVIESYDADKNAGAALHDFRASRDSYAQAYASLAGDRAEPVALTNLRSADSLRATARSVRASRAAAATPKVGKLEAVPTATPSLVTTDGFALKGVQEDWQWFLGLCNQRNAYFSGEDYAHCYGASLTPGNWTVTHNPDGFEEANIMIFDADSTQNANLTVTGIDCGFLELGLCSGLIAHNVVTPPRYTNSIYAESDDGFITTATGRSIALHYVYWD